VAGGNVRYDADAAPFARGNGLGQDVPAAELRVRVKRTPGINAYFAIVAMRTVLAFTCAMVSASASASNSSFTAKGGS